jgi:Lon protease-like protein
MAAPLAIFPLDVVLFPGALLPLHIFEPRYRQMLADCVERQQPFGLVQPAPDGERPPPGAIGALAQLQHHEPLPDGRSHILVQGSGRFRLTRYLESDRLYAVGEPAPLADLPDSLPAPEVIDELTRLGELYRQAAAILHDVEPGVAAWAEDSELLSFQVAAELELSRSTQWRLLTLELTDQRMALLLELLPSLLDDINARAAIHVGARSNGKGPHGSTPDFV